MSNVPECNVTRKNVSAETIKQIVADQLNIKVDIINDDANICTEHGADELDVLEIVMTIEDECGLNIDMSTEQLAELNTVTALVDAAAAAVANNQ